MLSLLKKLSKDKNKIKIDFTLLPNLEEKSGQILKLLKRADTPLFIADEQILADRIESLKNALEKYWKNYQIAYSLKTNYEIAKLDQFKKEGLWAEFVSGREYQMAKKLGYKGGQIIFNGPYKKGSELSVALKEGVLINIDNFDELERVLKIAKEINSQREVGIRVNTEIPYVPKSRFGFSIDNDEALRAVKKINKSKNLKLVSFHIHIGTDIDKPLSYHIAARNLMDFIKQNIPDYQRSIKSLNFGGGFPASGLPPFGKSGWRPKPIETYVLAITQEVKKIFQGKNRPTLILEPGRYLVDDAVFFITKITDCKESELGQVLIADATVTMLSLTSYRPQIVKLFDKDLAKKKKGLVNSIVYGASCREDDILYKNLLPKAEIGDLLVFYVVGAYNQNMASSFIFKKPKLFSVD